MLMLATHYSVFVDFNLLQQYHTCNIIFVSTLKEYMLAHIHKYSEA